MARIQKIEENLNSTFQRDLSRFQNELKKRKDKIKKFDEYSSLKREELGFRFIKQYKKRENSRQTFMQNSEQDFQKREKHSKLLNKKIETASQRKLDSLNRTLERT